MLFSYGNAVCLAVMVGALAVSGCSTTKLDEKPAPAPVTTAPAAVAPPQAAPDARAVKAVETPSQPLDPLNDPGGALAKRSVYFDFDQANIKSEYVPLITAHGEYLGTHHQRHVVVQGNCDERGSHEYNLALGQRRADSVKQRLVLLGTLDNQAETISFGKEKPRASGHDEASWAQNRRADIVYR